MSAGEGNTALLVAPKERGTKMLRGPLIGQVLDWISHPVKSEVAVSTPAVMGVEASTETVEEEGAEAPPPSSEPGP